MTYSRQASIEALKLIEIKIRALRQDLEESERHEVMANELRQLKGIEGKEVMHT